MTGKVLELESILQPDRLGCEIARFQYTWHTLRADWVKECMEVRNYVYATDTSKTSNSKLPWKNKTTLPKLCQIRDNLYANYMASLFPKRKWLLYDAYTKDSNTQKKRDAIKSYMCYVIDQRSYKEELGKCIQDYIDTGNAFCITEWRDDRVEIEGRQQVGYVGPSLRRLSPMDIVFNPTAPDFDSSPKIVRSIVSIGEVKDMLMKLSDDGNRDAYEALYAYLKDIRRHVQGYGGELSVKDDFYRVDGFTSYQLYLQSNYCELLTFYGDIYDADTDTFLKNQIITVVDRHKVIDKRPNPSALGRCPIRHIGWRKRQDNLWAMGPLANLVGMQYRIDHIENLKADVFDLITFPPLKIKGYVEDFQWGPFAKIVTDADSDVEMIAPPWNVLTAEQEIIWLMNLMEEMAGSPKEAMGFRTPGEKTKYEVQRLENAASRIFNNKTGQFEESFMEPQLNDSLELARRKVDSTILAKYFNDDLKATTFLELSVDDISGEGRIRPYAARHFAEQAEMVQNLTTLSQSPLWQHIGPHFSTIKLANLFESLLELDDWEIVRPYVVSAEQADAQRLANAQMEQVLVEAMTAAGLTPEDSSQPLPITQAMAPGPLEQQTSPAPPAQGAPGGY